MMESNGPNGDAFYSEIQSSGLPVPSGLGDMNFRTDEALTPKCNTVCYMKSEGGKHIHNSISTNSRYICYAVKGNLIRVIHAATGDKILLRGHDNPICDMRFSSADLDVLCSVDEGTQGPNIFVWKLSKEKEFTSTVLCSIPFSGNCIHSHPLSACIWAVSNQNVLCLFSTKHSPKHTQPLSYRDFPLHHIFVGEVADFSFSLDGRLLAVATNSNIHAVTILMLPSGFDGINELESGRGEFQSHSVVHLPSMVTGVTFLPSDPSLDTWNLVTLTSAKSGNEIRPTIQVWKVEDNLAPKSQQTIICHLPVHPNASSQDFSSQVSCEDPNGRYLVVSDRMSNIVGCLAVTTDFTSYDPRRLLYHCTYLDLKLPVTGLLCGMVLTQEGANVGQVQHLQITCLQDQTNAQLAVQQYHIQSRAVYPISPRHVADEVECDENDIDPATCFPSSVESDMMNLMGDNVDPPVVDKTSTPVKKEQEISPSYPPSATGGKAGISFMSTNPDACPPGSFPDFALVGNKVESTGAQPLPAESVDIGVKSKGILLNALKIRPPESQSPSTLGASKESSLPSQVKTLNEIPSRTTSSPGSMAINHCESKSSFDVVTKKSETAQPTEKSQLNPGSDTLSSKMRKIPFDLGKLMGSTPDQQHVLKNGPSLTEKEKEEDEWEKASMTISRSFVGNESLNQGTQVLPANVNSSDSDLLKSLAEQVSAIQNTLQVLTNEKKNQSKKLSFDIPQKQINELKSGITQEVTKSVSNLVLGALEEHSAEAVAKILGSEQWREELSSQISSDLRTELAPFIAQTAKDSIRDSIKDNLRPTLVKAFKAAFESTIVPAYQSGTEVMFQQVQQTFDTGVQTMVDENKSFLSRSTVDNESLRREIEQLRGTVAELQSQIQELFQAQEASFEKHMSALSSSSSNMQSSRAALSYIALFEEGRVLDSLSVALELKNISALHWVLTQATKADGNLFVLCEKCKEQPLLLICTMQQVAYYLSKHSAEDLEMHLGWLHALVVYIISTGDAIKSAIAPKTGMSLKSVLQGILDTLNEAEKVQETSFVALGNPSLKFQFQSVSMFLLQSKFMNSK